MRAFLVALVLSVPSLAAAAAPEDAILSEIRCARDPRAGTLLARLYQDGLIRLKPTFVYDSVNVFALKRPLSLNGLTAVAVFGYDETDNFPFVRSPGTAPGLQFGIVTKDSLAVVEGWRSRLNPSLDVDDGNAGIAGGKEIACTQQAVRP